MHGKRAKTLMGTMDSKELRAFGTWWRNKQGRKIPYAYRLFDLLRNSRHKAKEEVELWDRIKEGVPYDEDLMRKYHHQILKEMAGFLPHHELTENEVLQGVLLLSSYNKRRQHSLFARTYKWVENCLQKKQKDSGGYDSEDYYLKFCLAKEQQQHLVRTDPQVGKRYLSVMQQSLDSWWIIQRLIIACGVLSAGQMRTNEEQDPFMSHILHYVDTTSELRNIDLLMTYRMLYAYLSGESDIDRVLEEVDRRKGQLPQSERMMVFVLLVNALIPYVNQQGLNRKYVEAVSLVYQWGIAEELLIEGGKIAAQHVKNQVSILLKLDEPVMAQAFLNTYIGRVPQTRQEYALAINQARIDFHVGNFDSVRRHLRSLTFPRIEHEISARILLFQADYELSKETDQWEETAANLISQLHNLRKMLRRHEELSVRHRDPFLNRISFFQKLLKAKQPRHLLALILEINTCQSLDDPSWLLAKIQERLDRLGYAR